MENHRIKTCVNFKQITSYTDKITNKTLLTKINDFIQILLKFPDSGTQYGIFQKSNYNDSYGIILTVKEYSSKIKEIYETIQDNDLCVFGYSIVNDDRITYLSENSRIQNNYYDFRWNVSISAFIQPNPEIGKQIHDLVDGMIMKECNYLGLGGEMGVYVKRNSKVISNSVCLTNSTAIYDDCVSNLGDTVKCFCVDYNDVHISEHIDDPSNYVLIVNIGKNGLKELVGQVSNLKFKQIIYIGCCDKAVMSDIEKLSKNYYVNKMIKLKQFPETDYYSYVIEFLFII